MNNIGTKIKTARKAKGLSRKELAAQVNLSISTIQHIENDNRMPSLESLYNISRVLKRSLDYFVEDRYIVEHDELNLLRESLSEEERAQLIEVELEFCRHKTSRERIAGILQIMVDTMQK